MTMSNWIRLALADTDKMDDAGNQEQCNMLSLIHHTEGGGQKELHTVRLSGSSAPRPADELADLFEGKAKVYSQDLNGVQQFELFAFYGKSKEPGAYYPFKVTGILDLGAGGIQSEGPTEKGLVAQCMRHTEASNQFALRAMASAFESQAKVVEKLTDQNVALMHENAEAFKIVKTMVLEQNNEDHQQRMAEIAAAESAQMKSLILKMGPPLLNTLTGKEVFPQSFADTQLIETIAAKIKPEQLEQLANLLPPEIVGVIASRFADVAERQQSAQITGNVTEELGDDDSNG